jgi:hypothetical protein
MNRIYTIRFCAAIISAMILTSAPVDARPLRVTLIGLGFSAGQIAFDFIDVGVPSNSVSITESSLLSGPTARSTAISGTLVNQLFRFL